MNFEVRNGTFSYQLKSAVKKNLLENINFSIGDSQIVSILGANGAGKTTLVKCLCGLLKWNSGESLLNSKNIKDYSQKEFWSRVAYVPQAKLTSFVYTVEEMVLLGRSPRLGTIEKPHQKDYEITLECLDALGIFHLKDKLCSEISGGEYQLTLIARALACQPELLILDEPESNLDFKNQAIVMDSITKLRDTQNISVIMNTHFPDHAINNSDKAIILFPNAEYIFGNTKEVVTEETLSKAFSMELHMENISYNNKNHSVIIRK